MSHKIFILTFYALEIFFLYLKRRQVANPPPPPAILRLTLYRQHEPLFQLTVNRQPPRSPHPPRPYLVHHLDGLRHHPNPVLRFSNVPTSKSLWPFLENCRFFLSSFLCPLSWPRSNFMPNLQGSLSGDPWRKPPTLSSFTGFYVWGGNLYHFLLQFFFPFVFSFFPPDMDLFRLLLLFS